MKLENDVVVPRVSTLEKKIFFMCKAIIPS